MEKLNRIDRITDLIKERVGRAIGEVQLQYKGTKPYRTPQIPDREKLFQYEQIDPVVKQAYMQQDPVGFQNLEVEMDKLRRKYATKQ